MRRAAQKVCSLAGCNRDYWSGGFCSAHYQRYRKHGSPGSVHIGAGKGDRLKWSIRNSSKASEKCVRWPFSFDPSGYGAAEFGGKKISAHRLACILAHGEPKEKSLHAAHSCGNKWCVNPAHLRWATPSENANDKNIHGRMARGERNGFSKLNILSVRVARRRHKSGETFTQIAKDFGVSRSCIARAVKGETWNEA